MEGTVVFLHVFTEKYNSEAVQGLRYNENGNSPMVARVLTDVMSVLIHSFLKAAIKHLVPLLYIHSYPDISFCPALVIIQATHHRLFD